MPSSASPRPEPNRVDRVCQRPSCAKPLPLGTRARFCGPICSIGKLQRDRRDARPDRVCEREGCSTVIPGGAHANRKFCCRACKVAEIHRRRPELRAAHSAARRAKLGPARIAELNRRTRAKRIAADPERDRRYDANKRLASNFGITLEQHEALSAVFDGRCWICRQEERKTTADGRRHRLAVDHRHDLAKGDDGFVRGLLCVTCNVWVGHWEKSGPIWRPQAEAYLARPMPVIPAAAGPMRGTPKWVRQRGLTADQHQAMLDERDHCCDMCGQPETRTQGGAVRRLSIDHDHVHRSRPRPSITTTRSRSVTPATSGGCSAGCATHGSACTSGATGWPRCAATSTRVPSASAAPSRS